MKTTHRFLCLSLFASAFPLGLSGCAAHASSDAGGTETLGATSQADTGGYLQTFDPDFQAIIFEPTGPAIDWVILHVTIDGARTTNARMPETGTSAAAGPAYEIGSLPVLPGDSVVYSFTYSVNGLAQDTAQFRYTLPSSWTPPTLFTEVTGGAITVVSTAPLAWADVHYTVNGGPQLNVRLTQSAQDSTRYVQPVTLAAGDVLQYSVTYATAAAVFDTATASFTAPGAGAVGYVVDLGADSAAGACVANGDSGGKCNLRAALLAARSTSAAVTIDLSVDSTVDEGQIEVAASSTVRIESAAGGAARAITGVGTSRLFTVDSGVALTLEGLSIAHFQAEDSGGAIMNAGDLDLEGVAVAGNATTCEGTGAMTAFATCTGGAIASSGTLTLGGGTTFTNNSVTADAWTASYTTAWSAGGAVLSSGTIAIVGPVTFSGNSANAGAGSGDHGEPIGGANASASGGAIDNTGMLLVTAPAGTCVFTGNAATASATTVYGTATPTSQGGAIENTGTLQIPAGACVFSRNSAQSGADVGG